MTTEPAAQGAMVIDRDLALRHRLRWLNAPHATSISFLQDYAADELCERISVTKRDFTRALVVHTGDDTVTRRLSVLSNVGTVVQAAPHSSLLVGENGGIAMDDEAFSFKDGSLDLVVSNLALQLTNDTPGALIQLRRALKPDGLFSAALLGGETLTELRQSLLAAESETMGGVSPRVIPFPDIRDLGALLQRAGFALPVTDLDRVTVRYDTLFDLMRDLRTMGAANMLNQRTRQMSPRAFFLRAAEIYAERFSDPDGRIRATFDFVYLSGWVPHDSQQKPARRGSADVSMADVLSRKT